MIIIIEEKCLLNKKIIFKKIIKIIASNHINKYKKIHTHKNQINNFSQITINNLQMSFNQINNKRI